MTRKPCTLVWIVGALSALSLSACSSGSGNGGTGGAGGAAKGTGGSATGTGGANTGTGGTTGAGTGGASGTAGASGTGGVTGTGGRVDGGTSGTGGATGTDGGNPGDGGVSTQMNFFVSSRGPGNGGNLGGLNGADAFCKMLAGNVSAALGARTWHAYLSTTTVNARDRIGQGPWRNAAGHVIANNLTDLHDQLSANAVINMTFWPIGDATIALDERGNQVPITGMLQHDILTGSQTDGTLLTGMNCNDWTSSAMTDVAQVGHSNRSGGGRPPSWNSAHATTGCAQFTADMQAGTVSSGGGRGSIYCFAVD